MLKSSGAATQQVKMVLKIFLIVIFGIGSITMTETKTLAPTVLTSVDIIESASSLNVTEEYDMSTMVENTSFAFSAGDDCSKGGNSGDDPTGSTLSSQDPINQTSADAFNDGLVSSAMFEKVSEILSQFTFPILVLSLLCVFASIVVYTSPPMKTTTNTYLVFLSCAELVYVICVLVIETSRTVLGASATKYKLYLQFAIYGGNYLSVCCRRLAYCVTSLVALERLIAVAFPLRIRKFRLLKSPKILIPFILLFLFSFHVFTPLKLEAIPVPGSNGSTYKLSQTTIYLENISTFETLSIAGKVVFVFIPLFGCLLLNLLTVICLRRRSKIRRSLSNGLESSVFHNERQTTLTIIVSTLLYVLFNLPVTVSSLVVNLVDDYGMGRRQHYLFLLMNVIGYVSENLGNISNFTTYLILSSKFRKVFLSFVCCCRKTRSVSRSYSRSRSNTFTTRIPDVYVSTNSASEIHSTDADKSVTLSETVN